MFSKILAAVDGSSHAEKALDHAISLTKTYGSKLSIIYVVHTRVYIAAEEAGFSMTAPLIQDMENMGRKILNEAKERARGAGVEADTILVHGIPEEQISKNAEAGGYDTIVLGSRGRTVATAFLLGSVSDRVSHHAKCPVVIVK